MTQAKLQRFDMNYLRDLRGPIVMKSAIPEPVVEAAPPPPPPPTYNDADLGHARDAAKKLGYAEGFEAGLAQATTEATARAKDLAANMARMTEQLARLAATHDQLLKEQSAELTELVALIARKVAGEALTTHGAATIQALVERCLPVFFAKPRVTVEVAAAMLPALQETLREQLVKGGFEGDLQLRAAPGMEPGDVRIDWTQGQAARSSAALWQEIEALLQQAPLSPTLPTITEITPVEETNHG